MTHSLNVLIYWAIAFLAVVVDSQLRCNRANEEARCVQKCPPERTCRNRFIMYSCIRDPDPCVNKCVCKDGYYRNSIGNCITEQQCDQCSKPNEYYSCGGACDNVCKSIKYQNQTNCPIINIVCNKMCYCDKGYARDDNGNCIPISECGPSCSDPNEEYVLSKTCPPDSCESLVIKYNCDSKEVPQNRCICQSGYFRLDGKCIHKCSCPQLKNSPDC